MPLSTRMIRRTTIQISTQPQQPQTHPQPPTTTEKLSTKKFRTTKSRAALLRPTADSYKVGKTRIKVDNYVTPPSFTVAILTTEEKVTGNKNLKYTMLDHLFVQNISSIYFCFFQNSPTVLFDFKILNAAPKTK